MKTVEEASLADLSAEARASARGRRNRNLHQALDEPVQRFCNAIEPGSYVRPHRHPQAGKWELFIALRGAAVALSFDGQGRVTGRTELRAGGPVYAVEIPEGTWHTLAALEVGTVLFEIKQGPYIPLSDKDFAPWAPAEGDADAAAFESWFRDAAVGHVPPPRSHPRS